MCEFKKYPSIENYYVEKSINNWLKHHPELQNETFLVSEKIHGTNLSWIITKDNVQFSKRTAILQPSEDFFDYQNVMKKYEKEINKLQQLLIDKCFNNIRVFGEMFGGGIQEGIYYGNEKRFKIFDIYIDDSLITQKNTIELLKNLEIQYMFVPVIAIVEGLQNALNFNTEFNSKLYDTEDRNICEGIVIKPYKNNYLIKDLPFYLKKKNAEFSEKQTQPIVNISDDKLENVKNVYKQYLTENRVQNVMSKYGVITSPDQIQDYIKYVTKDAIEDFLKDNKELFLSLNEKKRKQIFGITGMIVIPMLNKYL